MLSGLIKLNSKLRVKSEITAQLVTLDKITDWLLFVDDPACVERRMHVDV